MIQNKKTLIILIILLLGIVGCSPIIRSEQPVRTSTVLLEGGKSFGQTFTANFDGLQSAAIYIEPGHNVGGDINLVVRADPKSPDILTTAVRSLETISRPGYYRFDFTPLPESNQEYYFFELEIEGSGSVRIGTAAGDTYLDGAMYRNGSPVDAQINFRLAYDSAQLIPGLLREFLIWLLILAAAIFLFILPGWLLLSAFWNRWSSLHWGTKLGLGIGLSLAIYPTIILWSSVLNLRLSEWYAWLVPIISIGLYVWKKRKIFLSTSKILSLSAKNISWSDITLAFVITLLIGIRFWIVRGIDLPLWGDSYQHTMITQLMIENRGLFESWQPYAVLETFTYHFGYHTLASMLHWVTGLSADQVVLWSGQIINGFTVIALFPLAMRLRNNPWSGIMSLLCAGLLLSMPLYYVNWGRYTQLTGLAILAVFAYFSWYVFENRPVGKFIIGVTTLILASLAMTHYRVLIFAIVLMAILFLAYLRKNSLGRTLKILLIISAGSFIIFLPWFIKIFSGLLPNILGYQVRNSPAQLVSSYQSYVGIGDLFTYLPAVVWALLPILIGWALWRKQKSVAIIALWWFVLFVIANPQWFNLPGTGTITAFAVLISAFFPASLIISESTGWIIDFLTVKIEEKDISSRKSSIYLRILLGATTLVMLFLAMWGVVQRRADLEIHKHTLASKPDLIASEWIEQNTPEETLLLVNSFFAYGGSLIAGSDGGWWLPLLANRQITAPPLNYGSERGPIPLYQPWINALTAEINQKGVNHPDVLEILEERNISHVYIGQRQGEAGSDAPLLDVGQLLKSPFYDPIYHQDRVWIFEIKSDS